jgi:hypothetical protein
VFQHTARVALRAEALTSARVATAHRVRHTVRKENPTCLHRVRYRRRFERPRQPHAVPPRGRSMPQQMWPHAGPMTAHEPVDPLSSLESVAFRSLHSPAYPSLIHDWRASVTAILARLGRSHNQGPAGVAPSLAPSAVQKRATVDPVKTL